MFETIGILTVWAFGLGLAASIPQLLLSVFWRSGGLGVFIAGAFWGKVVAVTYVAATMIYFIYT